MLKRRAKTARPTAYRRGIVADSLSGRAQLADKLVALDESRLLLAYGGELLVAFLAEEFVLLRQ